MSRGFRDADETQAASEQATAEAIKEILVGDEEQAARSAARKAEGGYGMCEDCGRPIGDDRLSALPSATRCVRCQSAWEQANRL